MSLYDGLGVETAPVIELSQQVTQANESAPNSTPLSGWSSSMKLMASHLQRQKMASKAAQQPKLRPPSTSMDKAKAHQGLPASALQTVKTVPPMELLEDDLAIEIADEYDPMIPNSYEQILNQRKEIEAKKELEIISRREERRNERRKKETSGGSGSESDEEKKKTKRKETAAIPPPPVFATTAVPEPEAKPEEKISVESALEELSKTKAQRANPFSKLSSLANNPSSVASSIMSKYGWREGQGLGKTSQGISTALSVEKTSKRGGKIVNVAAEREQQAEQEKKRAQSLTDMLKNPTKVILLQNMVGPGEVDEELQPEITEECTKYGEVSKCLIFEIPSGASDDEAVRIFVEFARVESSIKAVIDLNGRFFGGRQVKASFYSEDKFALYELAPE